MPLVMLLHLCNVLNLNSKEYANKSCLFIVKLRVDKAQNHVIFSPIFFSQLIMEFTSFEFEVAHKIVPECLTLFLRQEKRKKKPRYLI